MSDSMSNEQPKDEIYSDAETEARREAALKQMLTTPHTPHKDSKKGNRTKRD